MKLKIRSPANIAFIKYWGQKDGCLILPMNDSFSMNLSNCFSTVEIETQNDFNTKQLYIKKYQSDNYEVADQTSLKKVIDYYQVAKKFLKTNQDFGFIIKSANSFPKKAGIASSASFFSALAMLYSRLFEKELNQKELSILARLSGSGSACRSIPDGFSWWKKGRDSSSSYAVSIAPPSYWDLNDLVLILNSGEKKVSSQEGHQKAKTSGLYKERLRGLKKRLVDIKKAFEKKDFTWFGYLIEEEAISMHSVMMTQKPPLYFWSERTIDIIKKIIGGRSQGLEMYFTIDAGENIHLICQGKNKEKIYQYFSKEKNILNIISNQAAIGTRDYE